VRRPLLIVATCCVVLATVGGVWMAAVGGGKASRVAIGDEQLIAALPSGTSDRPLVVWLGDSTILFFGQPTYPMLIADGLGRRARIDAIVRAGLGFTWYHYYCLMGPVLEARPRLVVFVLNLRTLRTTPRSSATLCSRLSVRQLARAMTLPLADIGLPGPRLLLAQTLRWRPLVDALRLLDAARDRADAARIALGLPPRSGVAGAVWRANRTVQGRSEPVETVERNYLATWREAVHERPETLRMIEATVRLATTHHVRALVVVSPVPVDVLTAAGAWNAAGYAALIERIRGRVARAGGELLDLHDAVGTAGFRHGEGGFNRLSAHLNAIGAAAVSERLIPVLARQLGVPVTIDGSFRGPADGQRTPRSGT
jgi:hypothetical protein